MANDKTFRFLVTAGNTREKIDDVRDWGNIFTGATGFEIARALAAHGPVELLTSNTAHLAAAQAGLGLAHPIEARGFTTHADLLNLLETTVPRHAYDAIFMTAAVADYKPAGAFSLLDRKPGQTPGEEIWIVRSAQAGKIKSDHQAIAILGQRTEKLVDLFRSRWNHRGLLFKFKLEVGLTDDQLIRIGQASRAASAAQYLIANTLDMVQGPKPGAYILSDSGHEFIDRAALPARLAALAISQPPA